MPTSFIRTQTVRLAIDGHLKSLPSLQIPNIPSAWKLHEHLAHQAFDPINTQLDLKSVVLRPSQ